MPVYIVWLEYEEAGAVRADSAEEAAVKANAKWPQVPWFPGDDKKPFAAEHLVELMFPEGEDAVRI